MRTRLLLLIAGLAVAGMLALDFSSRGKKEPIHATQAAGSPDEAIRPEDPGDPDAALPTDLPSSEMGRTPFALVESGSPVGAPPETRTLDLTVLWDDGLAIRGVDVFLTLGTRVLEVGKTSEEGRARFEACDEEEAEWIGVQGTVLLFRVPLTQGEGKLTLEVPLRSVVSGVIRVDGAPPEDPVPMELRTTGGETANAVAPAFLQHHLAWELRHSAVFATRSDAEGHFRFAGLDLSWRGTLTLAGGHSFLKGGSSLSLDRPTDNLVLELRPPPEIRGRVLDPEGQPVEQCSIEASVRGADPFPSKFIAQTQADGTFRLPLNTAAPLSALLRFHAERVGFAQREGAFDASGVLDLGDVWMEEAAPVTLRVRDPDGSPVVGAMVFLEGAFDLRTDEEGLCTLPTLPVSGVDVKVEALAYRPTDVQVSAENETAPPASGEDAPAHILDVTLFPSSCIEVRFRTRDGDPVPDVLLALEGTELYEGDAFNMDWNQAHLGASRPRSTSAFSSQDGTWEVRSLFQSDAAGRVLITGLAAGVPLELTQTDLLASTLPWSRGVTLNEGQYLHLDAVLDEIPAVFRGRVTDPEGRPVEDAFLHFGTKVFSPFVMTDTDGRFDTGALGVASVDVVIVHPGFAPLILYGVPTSAPLDAQLEPGRDLYVRVVDTVGTQVRPRKVYIAYGEKRIRESVEMGDGRFFLEACPQGSFEVSAEVLGREFRVLASAGPETVLEVPAVGHLRLHVEPGLGPGSSVQFLLSPTSVEEANPISRNLSGRDSIETPVFPGTYDVRAFLDSGDGADEGDMARIDVEIRPGETTESTVRFE